MTTSLSADIAHQPIHTSMTEATLQTIRIAAFHDSDMVIELNGSLQTIRPEPHPLYPQTMCKETHS